MVALKLDLPRLSETYREYLDRMGVLDRGFAYGELVRSTSRRHVHPPVRLWPRMVPTLKIAIRLRKALGRPIKIAAAYRPEGGALASKHKINAALDLDILDTQAAMLTNQFERLWYKLAVKDWCEYGAAAVQGLGLYCRPGATAGVRVHIDSMCRTSPQTWQHHGSVIVAPHEERAAYRIIKREGYAHP